MKTALRRGGSQSSLRYVSTSVGNELTTTIVGDVNQTSGTQKISDTLLPLLVQFVLLLKLEFDTR